MEEHTFAICAYGESPYLEECIKSVKNQSVKSKVILSTSTPCDYIQRLCKKYSIPYFINYGESGITQDWNFAYSKAETPIVTIAHQDDIYFRKYSEYVIKSYKGAKVPLIFFSDYYELRNEKIVKNTLLLNIKRLMLFPLRATFLQSNIFVRRRILALGSPICCPSVAFFKHHLPPPFLIIIFVQTKIGKRGNEFPKSKDNFYTAKSHSWHTEFIKLQKHQWQFNKMGVGQTKI